MVAEPSCIQLCICTRLVFGLICHHESCDCVSVCSCALAGERQARWARRLRTEFNSKRMMKSQKEMSVPPEMAEIAECTVCQLIITKIPFIPLRRTLFPVSSPQASESCSPFTHAGILPPSEMHRYAARLPACSLARAHAFLVTKTAASIVGDGLINSFVLVCQHMLRRTHMEWGAEGGDALSGRAALLPRRATTAPRRRRIIGYNGVIHFCPSPGRGRL